MSDALPPYPPSSPQPPPDEFPRPGERTLNLIEPRPPLPAGLESQPVAVFVGGLAAVIDAGIVAGNLLGWLDLTGEQTAAVVGFVTTAATFAGATLRQLVFCRRTVRGTASPP